MPKPPLTDIQKYTLRYGTPADAGQITQLLADAESLCRHYAQDDRYDPPNTPDWVVGLVCAMAHRTVQNPAGVKQESFVDSYSVSYADGGGGTGVWLTADEVAMLVGAVIA